MSENKIQILLEMIDKASPEFKKMNAEAIKQVKALENQSKESSKNIIKDKEKESDEIDKSNKKSKNGLQKLSDAVRGFRSQLLAVTLAIGAVSIATNEWAKRNQEARNSLLELQISGGKVLAFLAKFSPLLVVGGAAARVFNKATGDDTVDSVTRGQAAIKEFQESVKNNEVLFQSGRISAEEYYAALLLNGDNVIEKNQLLAQSYNELASLQLELNNRELLDKRLNIEEEVALLNFSRENHKTAMQGMAALTISLSKTISGGLGNALTGIVTGATKAKDAFLDLGKSMIGVIINFMVQQVVASILEATLLKKRVAQSVTAGAAIAKAYGPAAVAVNIASFGAAGVAAGTSALFAGVSTAAAMSFAGIGGASGGGAGAASTANRATLLTEFHSGGMIRAHNGLAVDEVPIIAQTGEGVLSRRGMSALGGAGELNRLNGGDRGGSFGDINIFIQGGINSAGASINEMAEQLGFAFEKEVRLARGF